MKRFDKVRIKDLEPGDIFTHEIKVNNREAFKVVEHKSVKQSICQSRTTGKETNKQSEIKVYYLRSEK